MATIDVNRLMETIQFLKDIDPGEVEFYKELRDYNREAFKFNILVIKKFREYLDKNKEVAINFVNEADIDYILAKGKYFEERTIELIKKEEERHKNRHPTK